MFIKKGVNPYNFYKDTGYARELVKQEWVDNRQHKMNENAFPIIFKAVKNMVFIKEVFEIYSK